MDKRFNRYFDFITREGKEDLLNYLHTSGYFTAPASTQYHLSKEGGLVVHSCNVTEHLFDVAKALNADVDAESMAIVGLFHDIGKAGYYGKPQYVENILKSGKRSDAKPYETNKEILSVPHEVSAIHTLSKFIELTEEETFAILYHNGLYTSLGYSLKGNEQPLQMLLHSVDMWASRVTERGL